MRRNNTKMMHVPNKLKEKNEKNISFKTCANQLIKNTETINLNTLDLQSYKVTFDNDYDIEPTLSKQTRFSCPQMFILWGLIQKMPTFFSLLWAYTMPAVIAAGSAGGTVIVMISRDSIIISPTSTYS